MAQLLVVCVLAFASCSGVAHSATITAKCDLAKNTVGTYNDTISGTVMFEQVDDGPTKFTLDLKGFYVGEGSVSSRGFHIHTDGTIGVGGCADTGGHYNPDGVDHADRLASPRHVGDLGNIDVDAQGGVQINFNDDVVSLSGDKSVMGRAIVVHEGTDDLGLGGHEDSKTTGNAGARPACCTITDTTSSAASVKLSFSLLLAIMFSYYFL